MYLYLAGAIMLELNVLSFTAHHWMTFREDPSPGVFVYARCSRSSSSST
jgi:delta14-sterol reductase